MLTPRILALFALVFTSLEGFAQAHDCQMIVVPFLPVHVVHGPIPLKVTFTNSGSSVFTSFRDRNEMLQVPPIKFDRLRFYQFSVRNAEGELLTDSHLAPQKPFSPPPRFMEQHAWISVGPGRSTDRYILLNHWLHLPRGEYTIECVYQFPADSKMVSAFNLKVEAPSPSQIAQTVEQLAIPLESTKNRYRGGMFHVLGESLRSIVKNSNEWGLPPQFVETILKTNAKLRFLSMSEETRDILVERQLFD
jgi:hypothetical protein